MSEEKLPNPRKGEALCVIDGEEYLLKYNFTNLVELLKALKRTGKELFLGISDMNLDLIRRVLYAGILKGQSWPERYGDKAPTLVEISDLMCFAEVESYVESIMVALRGSEFIDESKKKEKEEKEPA